MDADMRPKRGQYLLMTMKPEALSFFPPLSTTQKNDYRLVPFFPLYSGAKVYCRFVYHNGKFHDSTVAHPRNEYRIYLNREVQGGELRFVEGGIVVFRLVDESDFSRGMFLDYAGPLDGELYRAYDKLLHACAV